MATVSAPVVATSKKSCELNQLAGTGVEDIGFPNTIQVKKPVTFS
jgi:hypothetical protein